MSAIPGYLTIAEAAVLIGVDPSQVSRYCAGKSTVKLPAKKVGRQWLIKEADAKKFERPPMGNPELLESKSRR